MAINGTRSVDLSSSEAEWMVLLETVKELMIVIQLLQRMKLSVKIPFMVLIM